MKRNSPQRREAKRQELICALRNLSDQMHANYQIEMGIKVIAEALLFVLEDTCKKKQ